MRLSEKQRQMLEVGAWWRDGWMAPSPDSDALVEAGYAAVRENRYDQYTTHQYTVTRAGLAAIKETS